MHSIFAIATGLLATAFAAPATTSLEARQAGGFTGEMTFYDPGLGSCGVTSDNSQPVVALALSMMQNPPNPNNNPLCGQTITIEYEGRRNTATIVDSCFGCAHGDIDVSRSLFATVAPNGDGRVPGVSWWFNSTPDGGRP